MQKILIIALVVAVVALAGVVVYQKLNQPEITPVVVNQLVATTSDETPANANIYEWKQFSDVLEKINAGAVSDIRADSIKTAIEGKLINKEIGMSISSIDYVDLDEDGKDEVVFNKYGGGTGGSYGALVYRLVISPTNSNYLANVEVVRSFKENLKEGNQGHMGFKIVGNQLMEYFAVYQGPDPNCCPTGGIRFILFKWDSGVKKIVVNKVVNLDFTWYQKVQNNGNFKVATDEAIRIFGINNQPPISDQTAGWKIYKNNQLEFKYPEELILQEKENQVSLNHSITYKHGNPCDFKGDGTVPALEKLTDFDVSFKVFNQGLKETVQSSQGSDNIVNNFFGDNTFKLSQGFIDTFNAGSLKGFQITSGVEGCGEFTYYFPISETKTLFARRTFITEFSPIMGDYQTSLKLPGIINPSQEIDFFTKILSSFKIY